MASSALVAVEIAPPDAGTALKQSLLDACSRAAEQRCTEPQGETEPNIVAIISWRDPLHATVEVALRREQRWIVRTMAFVDQDAPEERWRAVGLVIGTLASHISHNIEPPPVEGNGPTLPPPSGGSGSSPAGVTLPAPAVVAGPPEEPDRVEPAPIVETPMYVPPPRPAWIGV